MHTSARTQAGTIARKQGTDEPRDPSPRLMFREDDVVEAIATKDVDTVRTAITQQGFKIRADLLESAPLKLLKKLHRSGVDLDDCCELSLVDTAAAAGRSDIIAWCAPPSGWETVWQDTMEVAASCGKVNVLEYLVGRADERLGDWEERTAIACSAASEGHFGVIQWMCEKRYSFSWIEVEATARKHGHELPEWCGLR